MPQSLRRESLLPRWCQRSVKKPSTDPDPPPVRVKLGSNSPRIISWGLRYAEYSAYISQKWRADERTRTADLLITSELLYLLSYVGLFEASISQGLALLHVSD